MSEEVVSAQQVEPLYGPEVNLPEFTIKSVILAIILALILAASNAYLALKIGTTISASVPASILAIGILRFFKNSNVLESNLVQTAASAGEGVAAASAFILPAMILLGVWQSFPLWETAIMVIVGGILGVLFSVPLRRVMLYLPTLKFPEGTAVGNVLRISASGSGSLRIITWGGIAGGLVSLCQTGFRLLSDNVQWWISLGAAVFGCGFGFNPASLAAGYIIGIEVGISLLVGLVLGWLVLIPFLAIHFGMTPGASHYDIVMSLWSSHLRFVGVGTMLVGGVWTLLRLLKPVWSGLKTSFSGLARQQQASAQLPRTERDISIKWVLLGTVIFSILLYFLLAHIVDEVSIQEMTHSLFLKNLIVIVGVLVLGFVVSTVCAYFTGLIGSTNNPLSGIMIVVILSFSLLFLAFFGTHLAGHTKQVAALVIMVSLIVATMGAISNENLQDLKAGQMVGATPWKQQVMLAVGVVVSAFVLGPVLNLLYNAYGMGGVFPRLGMNPSDMLAAPQAGLMAAVAKGVLTHQLEWNMVIIGGVLAVLVIIADEILRRRGHSLPALAVGLGIYLPPEVITPIIVGGLVNYLVKRHLKKAHRPVDAASGHHQRGVLLSCGMVAGSAIMGVILAVPFVIEGSSNALALVPAGFAPAADALGWIAFLAMCVWIYRTGVSKT